MKTTTLSFRHSTNRVLCPLGLLLTPLALACFALSPTARAVDPPPDGGYPGRNTAEGKNALFSLTSGGYNTAVGFFSLWSNTTNDFNTAIGAGTLHGNTADQNTATGAGALMRNTTGSENTANGAFALFNNADGLRNNAFGSNALFSHITGNANNAIGAYALTNDTEGQFNNAFGDSALASNITGTFNTASGDGALLFNTTGNFNTAVGTQALISNMTGSNNIGIGFDAGANVFTASDVICIGSRGSDVSNTTWVDNIYGVPTQSGTTMQVIVSDNGQLGTVASSERFKKDIASMDEASEAILSLRPVTFHYKTDTKGTPQFGLIAEEVAKVSPALVLPDKEGKPYTVRYEAVNAMLLNEFLKEHHKVSEQEAIIMQLRAELRSTATRQQKQIEALTAGLQRVSAQLELSKPAPKMVLSNQ
jgi:trimeric autotransporter adhesin